MGYLTKWECLCLAFLILNALLNCLFKQSQRIMTKLAPGLLLPGTGSYTVVHRFQTPQSCGLCDPRLRMGLDLNSSLFGRLGRNFNPDPCSFLSLHTSVRISPQPVFLSSRKLVSS